jgi:peptidoglycan hydrolase CwlO-like protein
MAMGMKKILIGMLLTFVFLSAPFFSSGAAHAEDQNSDIAGILSRLDQVLANQKALMAEVDSVKQELNVIKIRVTQIQ